MASKFTGSGTCGASVRVVGRVPDRPGRPGGNLRAVTLTNSLLSIEVLSLGATVTRASFQGDCASVNLVSGLSDYSDYDNPEINHYVGGTLGRWCRVVRSGVVEIEGRRHFLTSDGSGSHLHGGPNGFHVQLWDVRLDRSEGDSVAVIFSLTSPAGHSGYPGKIEAEVSMRLRATSLRVSYRARTDSATIFGMSNHIYWSIGNAVLDTCFLQLPSTHQIQFASDAPTSDSPTRLREGRYNSRLIGDEIFDSFHIAPPGKVWKLIAPEEGLSLHFRSTEAGAGLYSGDLDPVKRRGFCFEFGGWPGAEVRSDFPSPILRPADRYSSKWSMSVAKLG